MVPTGARSPEDNDLTGARARASYPSFSFRDEAQSTAMAPAALLCALVLALGLWESGLGSGSCPDLTVDSCHCSAERSKELSRQHVRVKVACEDVELTDPLQPRFVPNTTVSL